MFAAASTTSPTRGVASSSLNLNVTAPRIPVSALATPFRASTATIRVAMTLPCTFGISALCAASSRVGAVDGAEASRVVVVVVVVVR